MSAILTLESAKAGAEVTSRAAGARTADRKVRISGERIGRRYLCGPTDVEGADSSGPDEASPGCSRDDPEWCMRLPKSNPRQLRVWLRGRSSGPVGSVTAAGSCSS